MAKRTRIAILGATGSIGTQTLQIVEALPDRLQVMGLSAHSRWQDLFAQARKHHPRWIALTDPSAAVPTPTGLNGTELLWGEAGVERIVTSDEVDTVVGAMVGSAGLRGALTALQAGKNLALANKETLVVGGPLVTQAAERHGGRLLPIDSEHSAIFQCLAAGRRDEVARIILTASGGPFRQTPLEHFAHLTVEQALQHPTWNMGPKITIDSATMMNKALEIIEAHWLFGLSAEQIEVVIHPQSMVHSMVEYVDGSVIAQVSPPDMRLPIQYALLYPERICGPSRRLDLSQRGAWEFHPPDPDRYPALQLGYEVIRRGGTSGSALNAANEVAVQRFIERQIPFPAIARLCREVLDRHPYDPSPSLAGLENTDRWARQEAWAWTCSV